SVSRNVLLRRSRRPLSTAIRPSRSSGRIFHPRVVRSMTISAARALIVIGRRFVIGSRYCSSRESLCLALSQELSSAYPAILRPSRSHEPHHETLSGDVRLCQIQLYFAARLTRSLDFRTPFIVRG